MLKIFAMKSLKLMNLLGNNNIFMMHFDSNHNSILSDHSILCDRKKPFASLLCSAYLVSERDSQVSLKELSSSQSFWDHVKECGMLIDAVNNIITEETEEFKEQIKIKLKLLQTQFFSIPVSITQGLCSNLYLNYSHGSN